MNSVTLIVGTSAFVATLYFVARYFRDRRSLPSDDDATVLADCLKTIKMAIVKGDPKLLLDARGLKVIPQEIETLHFVTQLSFEMNHLTAKSFEIVDRDISFSNLGSLETLSLKSNQLESLPRAFESFPASLTSLNISFNQLRSLFRLSSLRDTSLRVLRVRNNLLVEVSEEVMFLDKLELLDLNYNFITAIPREIGALRSLTELTLSGNKLTEIPEVVLKLRFLQVLEAAGNVISRLPTRIGDLVALRQLALGDNRLESLPESIVELTNLLSLGLYSNQLTALPHSIGRLRSLSTIYLHSNRLDRLPDSFFSLNLLSINLSANHLEQLPPSVSSLKTLKSLSLSSNRLRSIPESLKEITTLESVDLRKNPDLLDFPLSLREAGVPIQWSQADRVLDNLYIGGAEAAESLPGLRHRGVTHIVQLIDMKSPFPENFNYLVIKLRDSPDEELAFQLEPIITYLDAALDGGGIVLVHCLVGQSRSAAVVTAFLMHRLGWSYKAAKSHLRQCRPSVKPNEGFRMQLKELEPFLVSKSMVWPSVPAT